MSSGYDFGNSRASQTKWRQRRFLEGGNLLAQLVARALLADVVATALSAVSRSSPVWKTQLQTIFAPHRRSRPLTWDLLEEGMA